MKNFIEIKKQLNTMLKLCGVKDYVNNTLLLCAHVLGTEKKDAILINEISDAQAKKIMKLALRRATGEPLQYIIGNTEFYGNIIVVNKNVLIPRNETEQLCDIVCSRFSENSSVLDLCCGSGCIGLGIKRATNANVTLADVSGKALKVAKKNAQLNKLKVNFVKSNLFNNINGKFNVIVSNPPYIKTKDLSSLQIEVQHEPKLALDGKQDGLYFYKEIINKLPQHLENNGEIYFECGAKQACAIAKCLEKNFECIKIIKDYYGINRFVYAKLKENYVR